jgi:5-methylcytosine-specific restriction endonuclease McrA
MTTKPKQRGRLFMTRTQKIHWNTTKRAREHKQHLDYDLEDFRQLVECAKGEGCYYCGREITDANFSLDHLLPVSRGGTFLHDNLDITCKKCNTIKGVLEGCEFVALLNLMATWPQAVKQDILDRLYSGGKRFRQ